MSTLRLDIFKAHLCRTYTLRLYNAGLVLAHEVLNSNQTMPESQWEPYITTCIRLLEEIVNLNVIATSAVGQLHAVAAKLKIQ